MLQTLKSRILFYGQEIVIMTMKQIEINVPEAVVPYANVEGDRAWSEPQVIATYL